MSANLRIALRFLFARKRSMLMSLAGIVFGVGFFIVTQAQTSGFEDFFIRTILGTDGAIVVEDKFQDTTPRMMSGGNSEFFVEDRRNRRFVEGVEHPQLLRDSILALFPNVSGVSEVLRESVTAESPLRTDSAQIFGIQLADHLAVSNLAQQIVFGDLQDFRRDDIGVLVGRNLAERLQLDVGDPLTLEVRGQRRRYKVSAIFQTGYREIDKTRIFMKMGEARSLLKKPFGATFLQVQLFDRDRALQDAMRMQEVLSYNAVPWQIREKVWLDVFKVLKVSSALTVSTIILISGLGMFNTLAMIVMEKTREISILRSMGYTRRDISRIFLWQGTVVLALGTVFGWMFGWAVTYGVSSLPIRIRGIFTSDTFVVTWDPWHYVIAAATAAVVVMVASFIPARRAARLEPGDVIRGTAT